MSRGDHETVDEVLEMMDRQLRLLVRLIDDLLDISRISRGKIELRRVRSELSPLLRTAIDSTRSAFDEAGVELHVTLPSEPFEIDADAARLPQVFANLLINAAKYTDPGGQVWLRAERQGDQLVVTVCDTGIGIRPERLTDVFEMFTQADDSPRSQSGLGIGLFLVRALVELHGGAVEAYSKGLGHGCEFVVRLPVLNQCSHAEQLASHAAPHSTTKRRILVVDDNCDAARSLSTMLELMGNDVCTATEGSDAIVTAETFRPHLVLLDLGMPKLSGYEAAQRIRKEPWGENMTLVALTGWGQDEDRRKTREAGFDLHLVKPVDRDALADVLGKVANRCPK